MSYNTISSQGTATVTLTANQSIAVQSLTEAQVFEVVGFPNYTTKNQLEGTVVNEETVFGPYSAGATIVIEASASPVYYAVGTAPVVGNNGKWQPQPTPVAVNTTGAVSATAILGGIVTSTTAAAVAGTVPTGAVMDAATEWAIGDSVDWCVINTGNTNDFTVTAATAHTLVGVAVVQENSTGLFRTRKTAANTFVTYRIG